MDWFKGRDRLLGVSPGVSPSRRRILAAAASLLVPAYASPAARAAPAWPSRPVTVIVPMQAGSAGDAAARILLEEMEVELGQTFTAKNVLGEAGRIGAAVAAAAPADGYTLVVLNQAIAAVLPLLPSAVPVRPEAEFTPIGGIATIPTYLGVAAALPVQSVAEFIAHAGAAPGRVSYAATGPGSPQHLAAALFMALTGVALRRVDHRGATQAAAAVASGAVDSMFMARTLILPHLPAGRIRLLGFAGAQRSRVFPEIPTLAEQGVSGYDYASWVGLFARSGTPAEIVAALRTTLARVLVRRGVAERLALAGNEVWPVGAAELDAAMREDTARWQAVIQRGHLTF